MKRNLILETDRGALVVSEGKEARYDFVLPQNVSSPNNLRGNPEKLLHPTGWQLQMENGLNENQLTVYHQQDEKVGVNSRKPIGENKREGYGAVNNSVKTSKRNNKNEDHQLVLLQQVQNKRINDPYGDEGKYTGVMIGGKPHGQGKMLYKDGRVYMGEWRQGRWHGRGHAIFANKDAYVGQYKNDQRHGHGRYEWCDGRVYDGLFEMDHRQGHGTYTWPDGAVYTGDFHKGLRHGKGRYIFSDGSVYSGDWKEGKYHGEGECIWADGRRYRGQWHMGKAHGKGIEHRPDGTIRHDGEWKKDRPIRRPKEQES